MFYTLQGEGANAGRAAVFCRFAGCNLWSGRETDRSVAICRFCDTDFVGTDGPGGDVFRTADDVADAAARLWETHASPWNKFVVLTGGEPLLQVNVELIEAFHTRGFFVAVETNGTIPVPQGLDWICVSPKAGAVLKQRSGNEIKLVYPQNGVSPDVFSGLSFSHFFLQPMDGPQLGENTQRAIQFCLANPKWRLSIQTHKILGIP